MTKFSPVNGIITLYPIVSMYYTYDNVLLLLDSTVSFLYFSQCQCWDDFICVVVYCSGLIALYLANYPGALQIKKDLCASWLSWIAMH